jgi:hypothetical protein
MDFLDMAASQNEQEESVAQSPDYSCKRGQALETTPGFSKRVRKNKKRKGLAGSQWAAHETKSAQSEERKEDRWKANEADGRKSGGRQRVGGLVGAIHKL